jgi:hypothetical protein
MMIYAPPESFPGTLYTGDGVRLAGAGPDMFTDAMGDALPFKALIHGRPPEPGREADLGHDDRVWVMPEVLDMPFEVMQALYQELTILINSGGTVGLAGQDIGLGMQVRDTLSLLLSGQ